MARELQIDSVIGSTDQVELSERQVNIRIASETERDIGVHANGVSTINRIATAIGATVTIEEQR